MGRFISGIALGLMIGTMGAARATDIPPLSGRVNDYANVLSTTQRATLSNQLSQIEKLPDNPQVAVLFAKSLNDEDIAPYSGNVFRAWKLGQKGKDNGALLVIAPVERKLRLEVGYGLEGSIPDARASMVLSKMKPKLVKGKEDWFGAATLAVSDIETLIKADK